ncbi:MAG TPA: hypothetical protein VG722_12080, partial [Tepidisphaeraceae bacterium]|nr:hypothetical protein [Tepidisphaeraceae bacterium]
LRQLASYLDGAYIPNRSAGKVSAVRLKHNNLIWAIVLIVCGLIVAASIAWYFRSRRPEMLQSAVTSPRQVVAMAARCSIEVLA